MGKIYLLMKGNTLRVVKISTTIELKQCIKDEEILSPKNWLLDPIHGMDI